jgi:hypothetical protein
MSSSSDPEKSKAEILQQDQWDLMPFSSLEKKEEVDKLVETIQILKARIVGDSANAKLLVGCLIVLLRPSESKEENATDSWVAGCRTIKLLQMFDRVGLCGEALVKRYEQDTGAPFHITHPNEKRPALHIFADRWFASLETCQRRAIAFPASIALQQTLRLYLERARKACGDEILVPVYANCCKTLTRQFGPCLGDSDKVVTDLLRASSEYLFRALHPDARLRELDKATNVLAYIAFIMRYQEPYTAQELASVCTECRALAYPLGCTHLEEELVEETLHLGDEENLLLEDFHRKNSRVLTEDDMSCIKTALELLDETLKPARSMLNQKDTILELVRCLSFFVAFSESDAKRLGWLCAMVLTLEDSKMEGAIQSLYATLPNATISATEAVDYKRRFGDDILSQVGRMWNTRMPLTKPWKTMNLTEQLVTLLLLPRVDVLRLCASLPFE